VRCTAPFGTLFCEEANKSFGGLSVWLDAAASGTITAMSIRPRPLSDRPLRGEWFDKTPAIGPVNVKVIPPVPQSSGRDPLKSALAGAFGGIAGAIAAGACAAVAGRYSHPPLTITDVANLIAPTLGGRIEVVIAAVAGAAVVCGAAFGYLMRHVYRPPARILFATILFPVLWTLVYAFVIGRLLPNATRPIPFVPFCVAAVVYGIFVAAAPPIRRKATKAG
jgi:hypothetical protein